MNKMKKTIHHLAIRTIFPGLLLLSFGLGLFISQYLIYQSEARNGIEQIIDDKIYYQMDEWENAKIVDVKNALDLEEEQEKLIYYTKQMEYLYDSLLEFERKVEDLTGEEILLKTTHEQLDELKAGNLNDIDNETKKREAFIDSLHEDYDYLEKIFQKYMEENEIEIRTNEIRGR